MTDEETTANDAARTLGKLGAAKGGRARANVLTPDERREIARRAVQARWAKAGKIKIDDEGPVLSATAKGGAGTESELPYSLLPGTLQIGDVSFDCHVLSNHRRVLKQREVVRLISGGRDSGNLTRYLERIPLYKGDMLAGSHGAVSSSRESAARHRLRRRTAGRDLRVVFGCVSAEAA